MNSMARTLTLIVVFCLASAYVISYLTLRNRGIRETEKVQSDGFLYDTWDNVERTHDLRRHHVRAWLFAPLNLLDQQFFGGPEPIRCILFDLV